MVRMPRNGPRFYRLVLPFPVALLTGALAADLSWWTTRDALCADAASWLASVALAALIVSLIAGAVDGSLRHVFGSGAAVLLLVVNVLMREGASAAAIFPAGPFLTALAVSILLYTGLVKLDRIAIQRTAWRDLFAHGARSTHLHHVGR